VAHAAANAEASKNGVVGYSAIEQLAGSVVLLTLLGEDGHVTTQDLEDTDGQADVNAATSPAAAASVGIGCVARAGELMAGKALAQTVKAGYRLTRGTRALGRLLDGGASGVVPKPAPGPSATPCRSGGLSTAW
jgi:hypothetical protein